MQYNLIKGLVSNIIGGIISLAILGGMMFILFKACYTEQTKKKAPHRYINPRNFEELSSEDTTYIYINDSVYKFTMHLDTIYRDNGEKRKHKKSEDISD